MNKIYWTTEKIEDDKIAVMVLSLYNNLCINHVLVNDMKSYNIFNTPEEVEAYVKEILKPTYYQYYKSNYELVYTDINNDEWVNIFMKWKEFYQNIVKKIEFKQAPFWKKILLLIKSFKYKK